MEIANKPEDNLVSHVLPGAGDKLQRKGLKIIVVHLPYPLGGQLLAIWWDPTLQDKWMKALRIVGRDNDIQKLDQTRCNPYLLIEKAHITKHKVLLFQNKMNYKEAQITRLQTSIELEFSRGGSNIHLLYDIFCCRRSLSIIRFSDEVLSIPYLLHFDYSFFCLDRVIFKFHVRFVISSLLTLLLCFCIKVWI